jgi:C1A family cysteine protease
VSLVKAFPVVRDQGQRGTCVAFASIAYLEYHLASGVPKTRRLSEQFLYWACKESDQEPDREGTYVRVAAEVVRTRGSCLSRTWRYAALPGATEGQGPPPAGAEQEALELRWLEAAKVAVGDLDLLRHTLEAKKPVVLSVYTFPNWDFPVVAETGEVTMPLPGADIDGAHAVCLVGYERNPRAPGGGAFVFRNSWGSKWAKSRGRYGPGYGVLPFEYVRQYGMEAFC